MAETDATGGPGDADPGGAGPEPNTGPEHNTGPEPNTGPAGSDTAATADVHITVQGRSVDDVLADLRDAGLEIDQALGDLGIVTGRAAPEAIERMRGLPGVVVELGSDVQLPDPDAPVQ